MKYLVIGGGAIGGSIAAYLTKAEKEVTLIARGRQLEEISEYGLFVSKGRNEFNAKINTVSAEEYDDNPDVILLCVKGYSLESTYPIIKSCAVKNTVIIPLLNGYGINEKISKEFPDLTVLAGCIYIAASVTEPGFIHLSSDIFKIVYGFLDGNLKDQRLLEVASDLAKSGITPVYSDNIKRDTFKKFTMVSPMAAVGTYCNVTALAFKHASQARDMYIKCVEELVNLAAGMEIDIPEDIVDINLEIIKNLENSYTSSMQKDVCAGRQSEADSLIHEVVRLGHEYDVDVPVYEKIAEKIK